MMARAFLGLTGMTRLQGIQWCDRMLFVVVALAAFDLILQEHASLRDSLFSMAFAAALCVAARGVSPYGSVDESAPPEAVAAAGTAWGLAWGFAAWFWLGE